MTDFKTGDRVKVTDVLEATIERVTEGGVLVTEFDDWLHPLDQSQEGWQRTIEKLPDPEPTWVNGDVVRVDSTGGRFVRSGDAWRHVDTNMWTRGEIISEHWSGGSLTVLFKAAIVCPGGC